MLTFAQGIIKRVARPKKAAVNRQVKVLSRQGLGRLEDGIGCREKSLRLSDATSLHQPHFDEVRAQACGPQRRVNSAASLDYKAERWRGRAPHLEGEGNRLREEPRTHRRTLSGYGRWHAGKADDGTGETLLGGSERRGRGV